MNNYDSILKNMLAQQLRHECRMSNRQIAIMQWTDIGDHKIKTHYNGREVTISDATYRALMAMPVRGRWVFTESPLPPENVPTAPPSERIANRGKKLHDKIRAHVPKVTITIG